VSAVYFGGKYGSLSYQVWAAERGVELPESFFGDKGGLRLGEHPGRFHLIRWLSDTPFYRDAHEIVAEKARYFFWGQQNNLGVTAWSVFLAIEGRRRNISNLWAFMGLAQLVNLSYAQNSFFLALLLTPVPLAEGVVDARFQPYIEKVILRKPNNWAPHPALYISILVSTYGSIFLLPFAANTSSFTTVTLISSFLPYAPLLLPYIVPQSWGAIHTHPHETHVSYTTIFRTISTISTLLHLKASGLALFFNTPESHYYRHSLLHPFEKVHNSKSARAFTALEKVFGAIGEHPSVSAVGTDVILSGLSLGVWAAIRGLDADQMLISTVPFFKQIEKVSEKIEFSDESVEIAQKVEEELRSTKRRTPSKKSEAGNRLSKSKQIQKEEEAPYTPSPEEDEDIVEGDEDEGEEWEIGALAWGLVTVGGLGAGSASVFGGEVLNR